MSGLGDLLTNRFSLPGTDTHRAETILEDHFGQKTTGSFSLWPRGLRARRRSFSLRSRPPPHVPRQSCRRARSRSSSRSRTTSSRATIVSNLEPADAKGYTDAVREAVGEIPGAEVYVTGQAAIENDLDPIYADDLKVGEFFIAIPIALLILVFVFGTLAFLLPFIFALAAIPTTLGVVWIFANFLELTTYVQNLVMLIGFGIAVDYSLLIVYRYREELRAGRTREEAVVRTMETAGRAVVFSGTAVAIGLAVMLAMPLPFMRGFGLAGLVIPIVSVVCALTLLPVLLYFAGCQSRSRPAHPRADRRPPRGGRELLDEARPHDHAASGDRRRGDLRRARRARDPALLDGAGAGHEQGNPAGSRGRPGPERDLGCGRRRGAGPDGDRGGHRRGRAASRHPLSRRRSDGSRTGSPPTRRRHASTSASGHSTSTRAAGTPRLDVIGRSEYGVPEAIDFVERVRDDIVPAAGFPEGVAVYAGGGPPSGVDFLDRTYGTFPWLVLAVIVLTYFLLLRAFRSLILPLKAIVLNVLSIGAAFGLLVVFFKWGGADALGLITLRPDRGLDPDLRLRDGVRPLDGLRGLPRQPHPRGVGRGAVERGRRRDRAGANGQDRHCGRRHHVRRVHGLHGRLAFSGSSSSASVSPSRSRST